MRTRVLGYGCRFHIFPITFSCLSDNIPTTQFQYQPKSNTGIESRPQQNILSRILKDKEQPNARGARHVLIDSCRVNDENTICDRCGSEVILKFHINGNCACLMRAHVTFTLRVTWNALSNSYLVVSNNSSSS